MFVSTLACSHLEVEQLQIFNYFFFLIKYSLEINLTKLKYLFLNSFKVMFLRYSMLGGHAAQYMHVHCECVQKLFGLILQKSAGFVK